MVLPIIILAGLLLGVPGLLVAVDVADVNPDSAFYGLEKAGESIRKAFDRSSEFRLNLADERLAEAQLMARDNPSLIPSLMVEYSDLIRDAERKADNSMERDAVKERIDADISILSSLQADTPVDVSVWVDNARAQSEEMVEIIKESPDFVPFPELEKTPSLESVRRRY